MLQKNEDNSLETWSFITFSCSKEHTHNLIYQFVIVNPAKVKNLFCYKVISSSCIKEVISSLNDWRINMMKNIHIRFYANEWRVTNLQKKMVVWVIKRSWVQFPYIWTKSKIQILLELWIHNDMSNYSSYPKTITLQIF